MCGISGIVCSDGSNVKLEQVRSMTNVIKHRGPDGEGSYLYGNVGLGHRRLAIIDLSDAGHQPMLSGNFVITFNGELYNYLEIRDELKQKGCKFKTNSDTEVILAAFEYWGTSCVKRFNGMWSFAILDKEKKSLFMSRDRFGIKPFYFAQTKEVFVFGSEIKQLIPFLPEVKVNRQILYDFLFLSYQNHNQETFFDGIQNLRPGHNMVLNITTGEFSVDRYYELKKQKMHEGNSIEESVSLYKKAFEKAIKYRLRSDVKVGTCLSGGLDSSYIAKVASEKYMAKEPFTAITAKSIDASNDESHYAKIVADQYGLNWKLSQPSKDDFYNMIEGIVYNQEEPFASPSIFMQYYVMKAAKDEGCIVMLDGQGGDETLLGYERYFVAYLKTIKNPILFVKQFLRLSKNSKLSLFKLLSYYLYFGFSAIKSKRILQKHDYILSDNQKYFNKKLAKEFEDASKDLFELQKKEICELQLPKLLKFEDRNSMAHSIEARVPFIDYELVELAVSLPAEHKICDGWSKYILRKSYGDNAPKEIVWRKDKYGFEAPTKKWMADRGKFTDVIKTSPFLKNVLDQKYDFDKLDTNRIWKLYNVAVWADIFKVKY